MKNFLLFLPLVFLLAGCTWSKPVTDNTPVVNQIATPNTEVAEIPVKTDWNIYTNNFYSYSIKYPTDWYVGTTYSEKDFTLRGGNDYIGGDTIFSNYENPTKYNLENPAPADFYSLNLMIYKVASTTTLEAFLKTHYFAFDKKEALTIGGLEAIKISGKSKDHPVGVEVVNTLVKRDNQIYVFNYSGVVISDSVRGTYESMIKSFTIIKIVKEDVYKDWSTFSNKFGGYSFKYPATWKAAINGYTGTHSLFGANATSKAGSGGVEIIKYSGTLDSYFAYMEKIAEVKYSNQEKIVVNGVDAIKANHVGVAKGLTVILKKKGEIFSIYINSDKSDQVELFNKLVESFRFLE